MKKQAEIIKGANELYAQLTESFSEFAEVKKAHIDALATEPYDDAHEAVAEMIEGAKALIAGCVSEDGFTFPKYLTSFKTYEEDGKLSKVSFVIKSKLKDTAKYKREFTVSVGSTFMDDFTKAHIDAIFEMYYRCQADENLKDVNEAIKKICVENNIPYVFEFALGEGKQYVTYIDNDKVIFNADIEEAIEISKDSLFQYGDDYFDLVREQQTEKLVGILSATQTTAQLIKANVGIINTLVGYKTKKRADRLIRNTYHKKAEYFNKVKCGFGYFEKEEGDTTIFSILEKHEDGTITVALNPFDIKTLLTVDVDVVAEVEKLLA